MHNDHNFLIRTFTTDGILVGEDADFAEDARFDWFEQSVDFAESGEVVQLIDTENDRVVVEKIKD